MGAVLERIRQSVNNKTNNIGLMMINNKKSLLAYGAISLGLLLGSNQTMAADNCYIMVHGHGVQGDIRSEGRKNWRDAEFSQYNGSDFMDDLLGAGDNFAIVGYNSTDEGGYPYWRDETAGEITRQIISIKAGNGDGLTHDIGGTQCSANDDFWVVSHSQGGAEMMWIAGNAVSGSPYYNTAFGESSSVTVDYDSAMNGINGILSVGGAITGTEGADRVCNGSWTDAIIATFMGRDCNDSVKWLQTNDAYAAKSYIGTNLGAPFYVLGGYKGFPGFAGITSGLLTGEDDGFLNLASQMSCAGSGKRSIESDLNSYKSFFGINYGSPTFRCNNANKGTARTYNLASVYTDHDAERNAGISSPSSTSIENGINCGSGGNMAKRINDCIN